MDTQINDIIGKFKIARAQEVAESNAIKEKAENALQAALRYQSIAAKKMSLYHKLSKQSWNAKFKTGWDTVVKEVCEEIERRTGLKFDDLDDLRTYGLRCECPVFAYNGEHNESDKPVGYLVFTCGNLDDFKLYVDTKEKKKTGEFPVGSIGELNGFNNVSVEVESIEQLIKIMYKKCD